MDILNQKSLHQHFPQHLSLNIGDLFHFLQLILEEFQRCPLLKNFPPAKRKRKRKKKELNRKSIQTLLQGADIKTIAY